MPQRFLIETPALDPRVTGLLSVVDPEPFTDVHMAQGIVYDTEVLGAARFTSAGCVTAIPGDVTKTFEGEGGDVTGDPFAIYYGVECSLFGWEKYAEQAARGLDAGQGRAIERAVQQVLLNPQAVDLTPTPGTPVKPKEAMGLLEQYAGEQYAGTPIIHVSRYGAAFLPLEVGTPMTTKQGTPVANGAGYDRTDGPRDLATPAGSFWVYVSGQVHIWRSDVVANFAYDLQANTAGALAERIIIATVDQFVGAVLVTTEGA